jgi:hypothetical protein
VVDEARRDAGGDVPLNASFRNVPLIADELPGFLQ